MIESIILLSLFPILHFFDMFFTYKYLKRVRERKENWYNYEVNYHRKFMKRFGLEKGILISSSISMPLVIGIGYFIIFYLQNIKATYFVVGMLFSIAYYNFIQLNKEFE